MQTHQTKLAHSTGMREWACFHKRSHAWRSHMPAHSCKHAQAGLLAGMPVTVPGSQTGKASWLSCMAWFCANAYVHDVNFLALLCCWYAALAAFQSTQVWVCVRADVCARNVCVLCLDGREEGGGGQMQGLVKEQAVGVDQRCMLVALW